jgi:hypothetical protein
MPTIREFNKFIMKELTNIDVSNTEFVNSKQFRGNNCIRVRLKHHDGLHVFTFIFVNDIVYLWFNSRILGDCNDKWNDVNMSLFKVLLNQIIVELFEFEIADILD